MRRILSMKPRLTHSALLVCVLALAGACKQADADPAMPRLELQIAPAESVFTPLSPPRIEARFTNRSDRQWVVIEPQDGSLEGRLPPHYTFRAVNKGTGEPSNPYPVCGMYGGRYDETTMHVLPPGKTKTLIVDSIPIDAAGTYTLQLSYRVEPNTYAGARYNGGQSGALRTGRPWPGNVFTGEVRSNTLDLQVWEISEKNVERFATALVSVDADQKQRGHLLNALRTLGSRASAAVPALVSLLSGNDKEIAFYVPEILGEMGPAAHLAVPALIDLLPNETAILPLGKIGPKAEAAVPHLAKILAGDHNWSRMQAALALGWIARRPDVTVPALLGYLNDPKIHRDEREDAIRSLGIIGPSAAAALPDLRARAESTEGAYFGHYLPPEQQGETTLGAVAREAIRKIEGSPS